MKREDIYIGTLMQSISYENYLDGFNTTLTPKLEFDKKTGHLFSVKTVKENALFIKVKDYYICLDLLENGIEKFLVNLGFVINPLSTNHNDGGYYVAEDSLKPYFTEELDKNVFIKKLKKQALLDSRIKSGIEH